MFIKRLREQRSEKGITQEDLAKKLNVKQQTVGGWETGRTEPDLTTLRMMAEIFNVSTDYLLGLTDLRKPYEIKKESPRFQEALDKLTGIKGFKLDIELTETERINLENNTMTIETAKKILASAKDQQEKDDQPKKEIAGV